ncbi:hypothetical protein [Flavobacterium akiainvivens]|nr:hypothetical protein [Flavobacterium akiainvivens]
MKNVLPLLFTFYQAIAYGQPDSLKLQQPLYFIGPDHLQTVFPKDDGLTYNQFLGETIAGHNLADGWRTDTLNGGFNKGIYDNPYIESNGEYICLKKENKSFVLYKYNNGKKFNGKIVDTLMLDYTPPVIRGILYGNPYYESSTIKVIFQADCTEGLLQGKAIITYLNGKEIIAECYFEDGEIVGKSVSKGLYSNNIYTVSYEKGNGKPLNQKETDKDGHEVIYKNPKDEFTLKSAYLRLSEPNQSDILSIINSSSLKNPLTIALHHIFYANTLKEAKEYQTEHFEIREVVYQDLKIVYHKFKHSTKEDPAAITECYDKNKNIVFILYENVLLDEIKSLNYREYNGFFGQFINFNQYYNDEVYGTFLLAFKFDNKGALTKASKFGYFSRSYVNGSTQGWTYNDFTDKVKLNSKKHPFSISKTD